METTDSIIISGSEYFMHRLEELLKNLLPQEATLCTAREQQLFTALLKNKYRMVLIEKNGDDICPLLRQVKQTASDARIILFQNTEKKVKGADIVLPNRLSESVAEQIKAIYLSPCAVIIKENTGGLKKLKLTERMLELFQCIWEELSNEAIGKRLFISKRTAEGHRKKLYEYAQAETLLQLMKFAFKEGWITREAELSNKFYQLLSGESKNR